MQCGCEKISGKSSENRPGVRVRIATDRKATVVLKETLVGWSYVELSLA